MLGERIRHYRLLKGLKQSELAELLFISTSYISAIEKGRKSPSLPIVIKLFSLLDCSPNDLFEFNSPTAPRKMHYAWLRHNYAGKTPNMPLRLLRERYGKHYKRHYENQYREERREPAQADFFVTLRPCVIISFGVAATVKAAGGEAL